MSYFGSKCLLVGGWRIELQTSNFFYRATIYWHVRNPIYEVWLDSKVIISGDEALADFWHVDFVDGWNLDALVLDIELLGMISEIIENGDKSLISSLLYKKLRPWLWLWLWISFLVLMVFQIHFINLARMYIKVIL